MLDPTTSLVSGDSVKATFTIAGRASSTAYTLKWYLDGVEQSATTASLTFNTVKTTTAKCVATIDGVQASVSKEINVKCKLCPFPDPL